MQDGAAATAAPTVLTLSKDQKIDLTKTNPGLKKIRFGMGWDLQDGKVFDLDAYALLLKDGKMLGDITDEGRKKSIVYFNNLSTTGVKHSGDNRTGAGDGDDETITVELAGLPADCTEVVMAINIYNNSSANFGQVKNATCRIYNDEGAVKLAEADMSEDYGTANNLIVGRFYKHNDEWKYEQQAKAVTGDIFAVADTYR